MTSPTRAAWKLVGLFGALIVVAASPIQWAIVIAAAALLMGFLFGVCWPRAMIRLIPIVLIAAIMGLGAFWSLSSGPGTHAVEASSRAISAGFVLVVFSEISSLNEIFLGMKTLHVPSLLTSSLALMLRSIDVLREERTALLRSRAARGGERSSVWAEWHGRAGLVGLLLIRAVDRSERVHRAMKARGWSADPGR